MNACKRIPLLSVVMEFSTLISFLSDAKFLPHIAAFCYNVWSKGTSQCSVDFVKKMNERSLNCDRRYLNKSFLCNIKQFKTNWKK